MIAGPSIGAHLGTAGALASCIDKAADIGAQVVQLFASGPQSWRPYAHSDAAIAALQERAAADGMQLFLHGIYLINLAASDPAHLGRSRGSLKQYLRFCAGIGGRGVIFHTGSHKGAGFDGVKEQIVEALRDVLDDSEPECRLLLENSAGAGGSIGARFAELGALIRAVDSPRLGVCLDTCHAFAAGYDLTTPEGVAATMVEFDREIGLERLAAVHANDSKAGLGSGLDRHENIGQGQIGEAGFRAILGHRAFQSVPLILEVPGLEGKGPDKANIDLLRRLATEAAQHDP